MQAHALSAEAPAAPVVAQVALEQPLATPLDYRVPESLRAVCQLGQRVLAPLGPRHVQGYVVALTPGSDLDVEALKPIVDVLDDAPLLTSALLRLTRWVSDYYMCPWGLVLKAAVPQGFRVRSEAVFRLTPQAQSDPSAWPGGRAASAMQSLAENGPQPRQALARQLAVDAKALSPLLRRLQSEGWVTGEQQRQAPKVRQRMVAVVRLLLSPQEAEVLQQEVGSRAPKQAQVLEQLIQQPLVGTVGFAGAGAGGARRRATPGAARRRGPGAGGKDARRDSPGSPGTAARRRGSRPRSSMRFSKLR